MEGGMIHQECWMKKNKEENAKLKQENKQKRMESSMRKMWLVNHKWVY